MGRILLRRLSQTALALFLALTGIFLLLRISGDPILLMVPMEATSAQIEEMRRQLGFDQPLVAQYFRFLASAIRGDFGRSLRYFTPAAQVVLERFPATLELLVGSLAIALLFSVPVGLWAAARRGSPFDQAAMVGAVTGQAVPSFWLGLMLIMLFSVSLSLLPTSGRGTLAHLVLPAVTQASYMAPLLARVSRSSMLEVLHRDYVRTARAKGLPERKVMWKHAFRNALNPIITVVGLQVAPLFGGAVIVESLFVWPGIGLLLVQSLSNRDFPVVQAVVFALAFCVVVTNLAVDLLYALINPRVRIE